MIKYFDKNTVGRDFAVGDIHGCFSLLSEALADAEFDESKDRLFSVGDLVDRGAESEESIKWLRKPWFHAVMGNHEQMAIDYWNGMTDAGTYRANGGMWFITLSQDEQMHFVSAFMDLPIAIEIATPSGKRIGILHADCPVANWNDLDAALRGAGAEHYKAACMWSRDRINSKIETVIDGIDLVIVGHTPLHEPVQLGNVVHIDTGAVYGRHLTLAEIVNW